MVINHFVFLLLRLTVIFLQPSAVLSAEIVPLPIDEEIFQKNLRISQNIILPSYLYITRKGNGSFELGNIVIRAFDAHRDTRLYLDNLLDIKLIDLNQDGYQDLVITGIELFMDEEVDSKVVSQRVLFFAFLFRPDTMEFEFTYTNLQPDEYEDYFFFCEIDGKKIIKRDIGALPSVEVEELKKDFEIHFSDSANHLNR